MKHLILTFFLVILCYSLFFDKTGANPNRNEINYIQNDAFTPSLHSIASDTLNYYTFYNASMVWNFPLPQ